MEGAKQGDETTDRTTSSLPRAASPEQDPASKPVSCASPSTATQNAKTPENQYTELQVKEEINTEPEEAMEVGERSDGSEPKPAPSLQVDTKVEPVEADMKLPESAQVKIEEDTKERELERSKEKAEPADMEYSANQMPTHVRPESHSENDSSATCSADEDIEGEPDRSR